MQEGFKNITERFSIVDVFAFLIPGAFLTLYLCWIDGETAWNALFGPVELIFPDNVIMRAVYFGFMAYAVGMLVSEASWMAERAFRSLDDISTAIYAENPARTEMGIKKQWRALLPTPLLIALAILGGCLSMGFSWMARQGFLLLALAFGALCFSRGVMALLREAEGETRNAADASQERNISCSDMRKWLFFTLAATLLTVWSAIKLLIWNVETVGILCFIGAGSLLLRRVSMKKRDIEKLKLLGQPELFRKAQLFQAYYELFRAFCIVGLILYWRMSVSGAFPLVRLGHLIATEFLCVERMLRFRNLSRDYNAAFQFCEERRIATDSLRNAANR